MWLPAVPMAVIPARDPRLLFSTLMKLVDRLGLVAEFTFKDDDDNDEDGGGPGIRLKLCLTSLRFSLPTVSNSKMQKILSIYPFVAQLE
jgi:hypothetical protein